MKPNTLFTVVTMATTALPVAAYLPSVPKPISMNTIDLDISGILAETEAALKVANEQLANFQDNEKVIMSSPTKVAKKGISAIATNDMDISDLMAEVKSALNDAGANDEWSDISQLLEESKIVTKPATTSNDNLVHFWGSVVWKTSSSIATTLGKSAVSFTMEQLQPDSGLSKLSHKASLEAERCAKLLASKLNIAKLEQEGKEHLARVQARGTEVTSSWWKQAIAKYFADSMTSPFVKIWENRASQTVPIMFKGTLVQQVINQKFTPVPPTIQAPQPVQKRKSYFFMQEKKTSTTCHAKKPTFVAGMSMPAFVMANNFLQSWLRYTSTCVLMAFMLRSMAGTDATTISAATNDTLWEASHALRIMKLMSNHSGRNAVLGATTEECNDKPNIPYFASVEKKSV
jgi:hypothetical protein